MLRITIPAGELFHEKDQKFESYDEVTVDLEHSLFSLSKWESKYQKPFLAAGEKTTEEIFGYIAAMVVSPDVDPDVVYRCSNDNVDQIQQYIDSSQSATTFGAMPERRGPGEVITSELIYYWMVAFAIPFECEQWHLNRLFSLIRICNIKNSKPTKRSQREVAEERARINAERRAKLGTSG